MRIEVDELSQKGINTVRFERNKLSVKWPASGYLSASIPDREQLFYDLNALVAKFSEEKQEALWNAYQRAQQAFKEIHAAVMLDNELMDVVKTIYEIVEYAEVRSYVYRGGNIQFPPNLKTEYTENDVRSRNYVQRTYLKDEYIDLVILTLGLRFMVPIWGQYVALIASRTGNEYKETIALDLLKRSAIWKWEAMERFMAYVTAQVDEGKASLPVLIGGLPTVAIPKHLAALALVRKLAVCPLNPKSDSDNLIKILFNFINGTSNRLDTRFGGNIGAKKLVKENAEDDNSSVWDMYKINQDVPDGDKILMEVFTHDVKHMAEKVLPGIDQRKVEVCLASALKLESLNVLLHHVTLTQWVMSKALPPKGIQTLPKTALLRCLAVTQAVLWEWGFLELALLTTAERLESNSEMFTMLDPRTKVNKALVERLNAQYPYWRMKTRRHDPAKRSNLAIDAIDKINETLNRCEWRPQAPKELIEAFGSVAITERWVVSGNIKVQMAELIIKLNEPEAVTN